jgi:hypothetical protein
VATALGHPAGPRAIVADDGAFAVVPLSLYLHGSWQPSGGPVSIDELDVVGWTWQQATTRALPGVRLIGTRAVDQFLVARFALSSSPSLTPAEINARAASLLTPAQAGGEVLMQRTGV